MIRVLLLRMTALAIAAAMLGGCVPVIVAGAAGGDTGRGGSAAGCCTAAVGAPLLDLVQRGYLGTAIRGDVLCFAPRLTDRLEDLSFSMQFRGTPIHLRLADGRLDVAVNSEGAYRPIRISVGSELSV